MKELFVLDRCAFFYSGDLVLDFAVKTIKNSPGQAQPIKLMLLDNQMPRITGVEVVKQLRAFISKQNETRNVELKEPKFVIVTAYMNQVMRDHLAAQNINLIFEKPLQIIET